MPRRLRYSRLSKREGKRYIRQSFVFSILSILLLSALLFWGIPSLIKLAIFLSDLRSSSQPISGEDTIPPSPPILKPVPESTNSASLMLSGFAEEGATVLLSINNSESYETAAESDGEFLFTSVSLKPGENRITARSIDTVGNESQASSPLLVTYDNTPPTLVLERPTEGSAYFGAKERTISIRGSAEPGASVSVNGSYVILSQNGSFSQVFFLSPGENEILVVVRDRAGNQTSETRRVTYEE